jgi:uncharacterized SAM-binding protein YcdF (DUF218 family)
LKLKSWLSSHRRGLALGFSLGIGILFWTIHETKKVITEPLTSWEIETQGDCGVVLTGGSGRVREGFALLQRKSLRILVISGVNSSTDLEDLITPMDIMTGVDPAHIFLEKRSLTTYGNALQTADLAMALRCRDVVLVTSQLHMYRARRTFQAAFPSGFVIKPHAIVSSKSESEGLMVATEVLKSLFYSVWAYPGTILGYFLSYL